jgi:hypothetical protein
MCTTLFCSIRSVDGHACLHLRAANGAGPQEEATFGDTQVGATQQTVTAPAPHTSFNKAEMHTHEHHEAWPTDMQRTRVLAHTGSAEGLS